MPVSTAAPSSHWLPRLLRLWALVALLTFAVMLTHQSDNPGWFGRFSTLIAGLLAGLLLFAALLWTGGSWLRRWPARLTQIDQQLVKWRGRSWFAPASLGLASAALFLVWFLFLGNHLPTYAFLRAFLGLTIVMAALALLGGGVHPMVEVVKPLLPWLGIVALLGIALITNPFYPNLMKTDEAFVFSMARNALETGYYRPTIYAQSFPEYYYGGIWTWMMAGWMKVAGVSLASARLYNLALAYLSLVAIWFATARLYDKPTAWYATLTGAFAFMSLNHIRFDIHAAWWLSIGLLFFSLARPGRWWASLLSGFTIGLSVDSNPVAYCFSIGLILFQGWEYINVIRQERRWFWPPFWLTLIGVGGALGLYLLIHAGGSFARGETSGGMLANYAGFVRDNLISSGYIRQTGQYLSIFLTAQPVLFALMVIGIITALLKRTRSDRFLLAMYAAWMGVIVFAYYYFPPFYLVLALPIFLILAGRGLSGGVALLLDAAPLPMRAVSWLLIVWLLASAAFALRVNSSQSIEDVVETGRLIGQLVPKDAAIVAAESYYFGMLDHPHFVGGAVETSMMSHGGFAPEAVWPTVAPDAVVFSEGWPTEPEHSPSLMSYMDEHNFGMLVCYQTHSFGRIELWVKSVPTDVTPSDECTRVCNPRTGCS